MDATGEDELGFASVSNVTMVRKHRDVCREVSAITPPRHSGFSQVPRVQEASTADHMARPGKFSYTSGNQCMQKFTVPYALVIEFRRCFPASFHCLISGFYCSSVSSVLFSPKAFRVLGKTQVSEPGFLLR